MQKGDLSYQIIGHCMTIHNKLSYGFREYIYCRAMAIEFKRNSIGFEREVWLPIYYDQYKLGARRVDFFCQERLTIEVKAKKNIEKEDFAQALNTLERLNIPEGMLINFGAKSLQYHHLFNRNYQPNFVGESVTPEMVGEENDEIWEARQYVPNWLLEKMLSDREKRRSKK